MIEITILDNVEPCNTLPKKVMVAAVDLTKDPASNSGSERG